MDESIEIEVKAKGIPELRSELKSLKSDLANATDPADIERLSMAAGTLADKITDINEKVAIFSAGSDFEKVNNGLSLVSDQLSNMDFEGASESAKLLTANIKNMNPADIANGFKAFAGTIGELSKSFVQMGLKLLANPLFLLVAIIGGIVIAIVMLKDKIGILQKAFDMMMLPINLIIQALKDLGDMMGLTAFAAEESADRQIAATERTSKSIKNTTDKNIAQLDREIARRKANGEDVTKLELKKQQEIENGARAEINNQKKKITELENFKKKNDGKLSKEKQDELNKAIEENNKQVEVVKNAMNEKDVITISKNKQIMDNNDKASKEALDKQKQNSDKERQQYEAQKQKLVDIEKKFNNEIADLNAKTDEEKLALQKKREQDELNLLKSKGLNIEKAQKSLNEKYAILETNLEQSKLDKLKDIRDSYNKEILDLSFKTEQDRLKQQELDAIAEIDKITQNETDKEEAKKAVREKYALLKRDADATTFQEENTKALEKMVKDQLTFEEQYVIVAEREKLVTENLKLTEEERTRIEEENKNARNMIAQAEADFKNSIQNQNLDSLSSFLKNVAGFNEKDKKMKKAIMIADGAISIARQIINTNAANARATAEYGIIPAAPLIAANYVSMGVGIASTIAATAKGLSALGGGGSVGGSGGSSTPPAPSFNLFGGKNQGNEATSSQAVESTQQNQTITVNAIVSETAITETQNRVQRIQQNAEL